jgi:uncharacterized protein DUF5667
MTLEGGMSAGRFTTRWGRRRSSATEAELITRLRELPGPVPEARFKSDLRAQLVAITARVVSESTTAEPTRDAAVTVVAGGRSRTAGGSALHKLRRPVLALAGASTVLVLLLGMAVWMSGGSLPGQSLYGVKRASENVQLSIAGNDTAKGQAYLQLAGNRIREVADLLSQPSAMPATGGVSADGRQVSPRTASLINDTLASADEDSVNGMQLLGRAAVAQLSKQPLGKLSDWLPGQRSRMTDVRDRIAAGSLRTRVQASLLLLERIATRTAQLTSAMGCPCLSKALADELGPVPCTKCGAVPNPTPGGGATLPVPIPGLGSTGTSGSLPSLSLPPLGGGSGSSSSGHAAGPVASPPSAVSGLPAGLPVTRPAPLPSSGPASGGDTSGLPVVGQSPALPVPLPSVPGLPGRSLPGGLPTSLPVPLPGPSRL